MKRWNGAKAAYAEDMMVEVAELDGLTMVRDSQTDTARCFTFHRRRVVGFRRRRPGMLTSDRAVTGATSHP